MTIEAPKRLFVEKDLRFWPFHEMFINHIKNMGLIISLIFTESGTYYNIAKDFVRIRIETIEKDYQTLEISTQPTDNIKKPKFCGLYTWLFNSSDGSAQDFLVKENYNHHQSGPLAWKLLTTKIYVKSDKEFVVHETLSICFP